MDAAAPAREGHLGWVGASAAAAVAWTALVATSPPWFFAAAAPFCAAWMAVSARATPAGIRAWLRPLAADLTLGVACGLLLYAATRAFLWTFCGGPSQALCRPMAETFVRFHTRAAGPALVLGLLVAPAEELFWRGVVQARLAARLGGFGAALATAAIAAVVMLASGEPFLALATFPTYATFGLIAAWRRSLVPAMVSHALWTVLIAAIAPPV